ncbi:hypothetical protein LP419_21135 [Massilia sp. H-1]|nr:hypothetical protein LP419_21135 [Massilia sp. H-1]
MSLHRLARIGAAARCGTGGLRRRRFLVRHTAAGRRRHHHPHVRQQPHGLQPVAQYLAGHGARGRPGKTVSVTVLSSTSCSSTNA